MLWANWSLAAHRAVILMASGLILLWVVGCGSAMVRYRDRISDWVRQAPLPWGVKFVLGCTVLAMVEEAITTTMTNLAPAFGVRVGEAYITASANYFDVVGLHSVVIFVSLFVGWAVILSRFDFSAYSVFVLFGITGTLAEMAYGGPQHVLEFGMWCFVYGLMIWIPARGLPNRLKARKPSWWVYPMAVFVPFLFIPLFPLALVVRAFFPHHPDIHFPPLR